MEDNKLIDKYNNLRNRIILNTRKNQFLRERNDCEYLDLLWGNGIYNGFVNENTSVVVGGTIKNPNYFKTGNLDSGYYSLIDKVRTSCSLNISSNSELNSILNSIYLTVKEYLGYGDVSIRNKYYEDNSNVTLESLKGKNIGVCLEDAVFSQNMLKLLGFNSSIKVSLVRYGDGTYDTHAYNLINFRNKNYIFDSRFPSLDSPVVGTLNKEEYKEFLNGENSELVIDNTSNGVSYFASNIPLRNVNKNNR